MIGQKKLLASIDELVEKNKFPRFTILVGLPGSEQTNVEEYIAKKLNAGIIVYSPGVDDMRTMIGHANKITSPYVFVIPDADNMSPAAKNCILKVVEEPPQQAYFVMSVSDINNVLETIRSRGTVMYMDKYNAVEINEYAKTLTQDNDALAVISHVCETPGDVDMMVDYDTKVFIEYVNKVVDNLEEVSVANMFKISAKIKLKETQDGYDLRLFWRMFVDVCIDRLMVDVLKYGKWVQLTNKKLQELQITGVNKQMLFDSWLTDIKEVE